MNDIVKKMQLTKSNLTDLINSMSTDSEIAIKIDDIKQLYSLRNYIQHNKNCFDKEVRISYNKEKKEAIVMQKGRTSMSLRLRSSKIKQKKKEECIGRLLSDVLKWEE